MSKSILQTKKRCLLCETTLNLEKHHVMHGTANRVLAERYGLWVYLCAAHHRGPMSPHKDVNIDIGLKMAAQKRFEELHSHDEWMEVFGRNYL